MTKPQRFESIQDLLEAEGWVINEEFYVKGNVKFPVVELIGHTPNTFMQKMQERKWIGEGVTFAPPVEPLPAPLFADEGIGRDAPGLTVVGWVSDGQRAWPIWGSKY